MEFEYHDMKHKYYQRNKILEVVMTKNDVFLVTILRDVYFSNKPPIVACRINWHHTGPIASFSVFHEFDTCF